MSINTIRQLTIKGVWVKIKAIVEMRKYIVIGAII